MSFLEAMQAETLAEKSGRFEMPSGQRVFYDDASHRYYRCNPNGTRGRAVSSVTGVASVLDFRQDALVAAAACSQSLGLGALIRLEPKWAAWLEQEFHVFLKGRPEGTWAEWRDKPDGVWQALKARELTYQDVWAKAAKRGTNVHRLVFEALCNGDAIDVSAMTDDERLAAEGVIRFWADEEPEPILVEQIVFSDELGVAGRLDFYGRIKSREGPGVLDLKTGGFLGASAHCQVGGGYPLLLEHSGWPQAEWAAMLQVADGGYTLVDAEASPRDFETAVACYRAAGRINGAAMKAKRARG